ncbi:MAG: putative bifunctional diguanylate cyclase/phosphodiesterase [Ferrimicrobium sp.]
MTTGIRSSLRLQHLPSIIFRSVLSSVGAGATLWGVWELSHPGGPLLNIFGDASVGWWCFSLYVLVDLVSSWRRWSGARSQVIWATRGAALAIFGLSPLVVLVAVVSAVGILIRQDNTNRVVQESTINAGAMAIGAAIFHFSLILAHQNVLGITRWSAAVMVGYLAAMVSSICFSEVARRSLACGGSGAAGWSLYMGKPWTLVEIEALFAAVGFAGVVLLSESLLFVPIVIGVGILVSSFWSVKFELIQDPLTKVLNRTGFLQLSAALLKHSDLTGAVLLIDLDDFKSVNDRLGHNTGDRVLTWVAASLGQSLRREDLVGRLGGDEFAIVLWGVGDAALEAVLSRVSGVFGSVCDIDGLQIRVDASIGVAHFPEHGDEIELLLSRADAAMYEAKRTKGRLAIYRFDRDHHNLGRVSLVGELSRALDRDELALVYQPRVDMSTNLVVSAEALLRWSHPSLGMIPPSEIIPAAEYTEVMGPLTEWVIGRALRDCAWWQGEGLDIGVSINSSARNLRDLNFAHVLDEAIFRANVPPSSIEVEITENAMLGDPLRSVLVVRELRSMGVGVSVDDFGTGYSSLALLRDMPITHVKIDLGFVTKMLESPNNRTIVRSIIDLAANLAIASVAEGVENDAIYQMLVDMGADFAQGYFISRPTDREGLIRLAGQRGQLPGERVANR